MEERDNEVWLVSRVHQETQEDQDPQDQKEQWYVFKYIAFSCVNILVLIQNSDIWYATVGNSVTALSSHPRAYLI